MHVKGKTWNRKTALKIRGERKPGTWVKDRLITQILLSSSSWERRILWRVSAPNTASRGRKYPKKRKRIEVKSEGFRRVLFWALPIVRGRWGGEKGEKVGGEEEGDSLCNEKLGGGES